MSWLHASWRQWCSKTLLTPNTTSITRSLNTADITKCHTDYTWDFFLLFFSHSNYGTVSWIVETAHSHASFITHQRSLLLPKVASPSQVVDSEDVEGHVLSGYLQSGKPVFTLRFPSGDRDVDLEQVWREYIWRDMHESTRAGKCEWFCCMSLN